MFHILRKKIESLTNPNTWVEYVLEGVQPSKYVLKSINMFSNKYKL